MKQEFDEFCFKEFSIILQHKKLFQVQKLVFIISQRFEYYFKFKI